MKHNSIMPHCPRLLGPEARAYVKARRALIKQAEKRIRDGFGLPVCKSRAWFDTRTLDLQSYCVEVFLRVPDEHLPDEIFIHAEVCTWGREHVKGEIYFVDPEWGYEHHHLVFNDYQGFDGNHYQFTQCSDLKWRNAMLAGLHKADLLTDFQRQNLGLTFGEILEGEKFLEELRNGHS